jgi:hypothetical protein
VQPSIRTLRIPPDVSLPIPIQAKIESAVGDLDILAGLHQRVRFAAPSALDGDTVIARRNIAVINTDVLAGIDIDAVAVSARGADSQIPDGYVFTVGGMDAPHRSVFRGESVHVNITAADKFDQRGMAQRVLRGRPSAERRAAYDLSRTSDPDLIRVDGVDQPDMPGNPLSFPANLRHGIVGEIRGPRKNGSVFQPERGVGSKGDRA